jgi:MFS transporter, putative metabolite:H+ symporter
MDLCRDSRAFSLAAMPPSPPADPSAPPHRDSVASASPDEARHRALIIRGRLERLPVTRYVWSLVLLLSLGGWFEYYDLFFTAYVGPGLVRSGLFISTSAAFFGFNGLASFVAATFAGLLIGTLVFSFAADRFGRRLIFTTSLLWYTAATVVMAFQHTAQGIVLWRVIAGIGIGVELVTIDTYITELMPRRMRGRAIALSQIVGFTSLPAVALLSWWLVPLQPLGLDGWRWVVLAGSLGAILVWFIRRGLPESPRWLMTHGKFDEAECVVAAMESRVRRDLEREAASGSRPVRPGGAFALASQPAETRGSLLELARPPYRQRTLMLMVFNFFQTIGYYGFASWVPTLLISTGITTTNSLEYSFLIALSAPLGPLLAYRVADRIERKWQIVFTAACIAIFGVLFARQRHPVWLITCGVLLTCANNCMSIAFHTYQAELFPTRIRAEAVGFVYSWSRLSAIFTSFLIGFFLRDFGTRGVFAFIAAAMAIVILAIGIFGPRTRGLTLEDIAH